MGIKITVSQGLRLQTPTYWDFSDAEFTLLVRPNWGVCSLTSLAFILQLQFLFSSDTEVTFTPPGTFRFPVKKPARPQNVPPKPPQRSKPHACPQALEHPPIPGLSGAAAAARIPPHGDQAGRGLRPNGQRGPGRGVRGTSAERETADLGAARADRAPRKRGTGGDCGERAGRGVRRVRDRGKGEARRAPLGAKVSAGREAASRRDALWQAGGSRPRFPGLGSLPGERGTVRGAAVQPSPPRASAPAAAILRSFHSNWRGLTGWLSWTDAPPPPDLRGSRGARAGGWNPRRVLTSPEVDPGRSGERACAPSSIPTRGRAREPLGGGARGPGQAVLLWISGPSTSMGWCNS